MNWAVMGQWLTAIPLGARYAAIMLKDFVSIAFAMSRQNLLSPNTVVNAQTYKRSILVVLVVFSRSCR